VLLSPAAARRAGGVLWRAPIRTAAPPARATIELGASAVEAIPRIEVPAGLSAQLSQPPGFLIPIYRQAGHRYRVPWRVLAAINAIETDYGSDLSVSSQGAMGWMQFMPGTWREYGDGGNPYDPREAIFAAARLLHSAGASHDLRGAIFAYNHANWYVAAVLWRASTISSRARAAVDGHGYALPLDARYMRTLGRTDDGVDIETAPDGAAVYSIAPGIVTAVAGDPAGFGPDYPVILATGGPLAGQYIYYGHVAASLVGVGQRVLAGQPVAIVGHTGDAASLGHGHIEIGFCDSGGDPLNHHGAGAWTPSGQAMRSILVSLSAKLGIANS
jgi:murein DD-endopeptidase MepM/ murein hydrolase activator NlpD